MPRPRFKAGKASHLLKTEQFNRPTLENGVLTVEGTNASDRIALRLQAGRPDILQVDVGDDGTADFSFERADVVEVVVQAGNGDDFVRIDESNGVFTDTIPTTIDGGNGNDDLAGGPGAETLLGGNGNDRSTGTKATTWPSWVTATTRSSGIPATAATPSRARTARHAGLQRRQHRRARRPVRERQPAQVLPRRRQHHDGHRRRGAGRLQRPGGADVVTVTT